MESALDPRFGRADFFLVFDDETREFDVIENSARLESGGAGIAAAQLLLARRVEAVITGQIGPNALEVLASVNIGLFQGLTESVRTNLEALEEKRLVPIKHSGPTHAGIGNMNPKESRS
jgi:predicted Fe-Mo cluster-binding NifX family protein